MHSRQVTTGLSARALVLSLLSQGVTAAFYYPDPQASLLEHILVDNWGAYASNFSSAITPCDGYISEQGREAQTSGKTTSAQWMRVGFHDFVTHDVENGKGGIDASITFETHRTPNLGSAMNDSFAFWRPYVNEYLSMADMVAIGAAMSVNLCGGAEKLPVRPGRVDATCAGKQTGVPEPKTDLEATLKRFDAAGFNRSETISVTACGHSMGSVHHAKHKDVVPDWHVTQNNTSGAMDFDTTPGRFDDGIVHEYIDSTGKRGGALVTSFNKTTRSDLRLFSSDKNVTMKSLYDKGASGFRQSCVGTLQRMLETIPAGVELQDAVEAMPVKPVNATFDFDKDDQLMFSGRVRILTQHGEKEPEAIAMELSNGHNVTLGQAEAHGTSVFGGGDPSADPPKYGSTSYFSFQDWSDSLGEADSFTVLGEGVKQKTFPIQSRNFIVPSMTSLDGTVLKATVATRNRCKPSEMTLQVSAPTTQMGSLAPKMVHMEMEKQGSAGTKGKYELTTYSLDLGQAVTGAVSIKMTRDESLVDTFIVDGTAAGW